MRVLGDRCRRHRVAVAAHPQGAAAGRGRARSVCVLRCFLGCHARLDLQVGDVRHRSRVVQAGACRDSAGRGDPGVGTDRRRPIEHRRSARRGGADGAGRVRAVHDLPVPVVRRFRSLQLDGDRAGG